MRWAKETADLFNATAATGALQRIFRWTRHARANGVAWLMAIEPGFDRMAALRAVELMRNAVVDLARRRDD